MVEKTRIVNNYLYFLNFFTNKSSYNETSTVFKESLLSLLIYESFQRIRLIQLKTLTVIIVPTPFVLKNVLPFSTHFLHLK